MCGRYSLTDPAEAMRQLFDLSPPDGARPRYNMAPSQSALVLRLNDAGVAQAGFLQWGLVPAWAKDPEIGSRLINARSETVAEKPSFRAAYRRRRCLVPADGYYEWQAAGGRKQPWRLQRADGAALAFAGLWEQWSGADGMELQTFCLLTTAAGEKVAAIHHRMPVIIAAANFDAWLEPAEAPDPDWLAPDAGPDLSAYRVSDHVNSPAHDDAECIEALADETAAAPAKPAQGDFFGT